MSEIGSFLVFSIVAVIYFAPAITAYSRKHLNASAILLLNLLLGWTFIGWVIAAVWASTDHVKPPQSRRVTSHQRAKSIYPDFPS
jgi:hypothetical protein